MWTHFWGPVAHPSSEVGLDSVIWWLLLSHHSRHCSAHIRPSLQTGAGSPGDVTPHSVSHTAPGDPIPEPGACWVVLVMPGRCHHCPLHFSMPPAWGTHAAAVPSVPTGQRLAHTLGGTQHHHSPASTHTSRAGPFGLHLAQVEVWFGPLSVPEATILCHVSGLLHDGRVSSRHPPAHAHLPPVPRCLEHL